MMPSAMTGLHVAPTAPCSSAVRKSSIAAESLHKQVGVVCVISCSGLFQRTAGSGPDGVFMARMLPNDPRQLQTFATTCSPR